MDILKQIREIVADVTQTPVDGITERSSSSNISSWDSVTQINIIVAVESEFGVTFTADQIHSLTSVRQIIGALKQSVAAMK